MGEYPDMRTPQTPVYNVLFPFKSWPLICTVSAPLLPLIFHSIEAVEFGIVISIIIVIIIVLLLLLTVGVARLCWARTRCRHHWRPSRRRTPPWRDRCPWRAPGLRSASRPARGRRRTS